MEWRDEGIILGTRRHGETSVILEVMTRTHGRHMGMVRGGRSRRLQPVLQPGNRVDLIWRARLDEHLGTFQAEALEMNAARLMDSAVSVYGIQLVAAHLRLLPERDSHGTLYEALMVMVEHLVLEELGFGLDLSECAATGARAELVYVSPKSGRAVSREAGLPWHDRMLALPAFLEQGPGCRADEAALEDAFRLSSYFLNRHVYEPRGIEPPDARAGFLTALRRHFAAARALNGGTAA
jgi:DNA repair protein RecO (recombination protein O)